MASLEGIILGQWLIEWLCFPASNETQVQQEGLLHTQRMKEYSCVPCTRNYNGSIAINEYQIKEKWIQMEKWTIFCVLILTLVSLSVLFL